MTYASRETYKRVSEPGRPEIEPFPFTLARDIRPNLISSDIVKDLIPRNAFGEVHADSAGGKTAIIVDLLIHVAAGLPYRGRRVEAQPVVFVALEGHAGIDNRIFGAMAEIGIEPDIALALVKVTDNFRQAQAAQRTAAVAHMLQKLYGGDCPVVAIDTYQAALGNGGSDCDPRDVSAFISNVQAHLLGTGFTVLVLHHFGKDASRGGRGWSGLRAALDFELEIERDDDQRTMRVTKSRDGSDSQPVFCYRFEGREVGINDHGEPVTAVVVHHLADQTSPKPGRRLTPKARAALNQLWICIKDRSRSFAMSDPPGCRCVMLDEWQKACVESDGVSKAATEKERARKFRLAKDELIAAGAVICDGPTGQRCYVPPKPSEGN